MTKEEKIELGIRAAETFPALFPDTWKHEWDYTCGVPRDCKKCGTSVWKWYNDTGNNNNPCTVTDPIPITWNNAMKLFRNATREDPQWINTPSIDILVELCPRISKGMSLSSKYSCAREWFLEQATPADYIEAACIERELKND